MRRDLSVGRTVTRSEAVCIEVARASHSRFARESLAMVAVLAKARASGQRTVIFRRPFQSTTSMAATAGATGGRFCAGAAGAGEMKAPMQSMRRAKEPRVAVLAGDVVDMRRSVSWVCEVGMKWV